MDPSQANNVDEQLSELLAFAADMFSHWPVDAADGQSVINLALDGLARTVRWTIKYASHANAGSGRFLSEITVPDPCSARTSEGEQEWFPV